MAMVKNLNIAVLQNNKTKMTPSTKIAEFTATARFIPTFFILLLILVLLFVCPVRASGDWTEESYNPTLTTQFSNWVVMVAIVLALVFAMMLIVYLAGVLASSSELQAVAKTEITQLIATAMVVTILFGIIKMLGALTASSLLFNTSYPTDTALYDVTMERVHNVSNITSDYLNFFYKYNDYILDQASKSGSAYFWGVGYTQSACSSLGAASAMLNTAIQVITFAAFDINAVRLLIEFGFKYIFPFFLTLGVLMRSFSFTRKWGGVLIAVAIAFYPVLPLTFTFFDVVVTEFLSQPENHYITSGVVPVEKHSCYEFDPEYSKDIYPTIQEVTRFNTVENVMAVVLLRVVFVTTIVLFTLLSFISAVSGTLGTYIDLSPLIRLV